VVMRVSPELRKDAERLAKAEDLKLTDMYRKLLKRGIEALAAERAERAERAAEWAERAAERAAMSAE